MKSDMAVPMPIMEFVQRFQALQVQRDTGDELIKVCGSPFSCCFGSLQISKVGVVGMEC